jgi:hypothetical protein
VKTKKTGSAVVQAHHAYLGHVPCSTSLHDQRGLLYRVWETKPHVDLGK